MESSAQSVVVNITGDEGTLRVLMNPPKILVLRNVAIAVTINLARRPAEETPATAPNAGQDTAPPGS